MMAAKVRSFTYDPAAKLVTAQARIRKMKKLLVQALERIDRWGPDDFDPKKDALCKAIAEAIKNPSGGRP